MLFYDFPRVFYKRVHLLMYAQDWRPNRGLVEMLLRRKIYYDR